jgi:hypothetical protein
MATDATPRDEIRSFQHYIFGTIDSIVGALEGLSAEELNWRPAAPDTNSLYAIATHVLGNAEENLVGRLCGQPHGRHYAGEWPAAADPSPTPSARGGRSCASAWPRVSRSSRAPISTASARTRGAATSRGARC